MSQPTRVERRRKPSSDPFPGRFRLIPAVGGTLERVEVYAGDEQNLFEHISAALNDEALRWWFSWKTGEVSVGDGDAREVRLIVTYVGNWLPRRSST